MEIRSFFNNLAANWDNELPAVLPSRSAAAMLCGAKPGAKILDIACGTGVMVPELLALGADDITGIDFAEKMIDVAREKFAGDERVRFVAGDFLEFEGENFDVLVMYNAYPHFRDKEAVLKKAAALLKKGGRFTVAHGAGRQIINAHHHDTASQVSVGLGTAEDESAVWHQWFNIDTLIDRPDIYVISGTVK